MFKAIKFLSIFLYHFFFIDQVTGHQSNTKFFANVGYIIWCYLFPYAVIHGSQANMELWLVFGAVVIGNRTLNVLLQNKAGIQCDPNGSWKSLVQSPVDGDPDAAPAPTVNVTVNTPAPAVAPVVLAPPATSKAPVVPNTSDLVS